MQPGVCKNSGVGKSCQININFLRAQKSSTELLGKIFTFRLTIAFSSPHAQHKSPKTMPIFTPKRVHLWTSLIFGSAIHPRLMYSK